jgi:hypothetical protein
LDRVKACLFAMPVSSRPCATSLEGRASVFIRTCSVTLSRGGLETTGNIKVAQEILVHSHLSPTADLYLRVDQHAMVAALLATKASTERTTKQHSWPSDKAAQYAFADDDETISELERAIAQASGSPADVRRAPRTGGVELADGDS